MYIDTIKEMLNDRNYNIVFENNIKIISECKNKKISVYFYNDKLGVSKIRELYDEYKENNEEHVILVTKYSLTGPSIKWIKQNIKIEFEVFQQSELNYNITKHYLQPKFKLLDKKDEELLLETFNCKISHIPKILFTDPICRYYNAKKNNIFEIIRKDGSIYYRSVL